MKFKENFKKVVKKAFCVILCMTFLLSSCITAFAFDGEVGGIDKSFLYTYKKEAQVLYNPNEYKVFSPFNEESLYWLLKWPLAQDNTWAFQDSEVLSMMTEDSTGVRTLYFLTPERNESIFVQLTASQRFDFPDCYARFISGGEESLVIGSDDAQCIGNFSTFFIELWDELTRSWWEKINIFTIAPAVDLFNGYLYSVQISKQDTILSVSQTFYGSYRDCLSSLPDSDIVQVSYFSLDELTVGLPSYCTHETVSTTNSNILLSTSTYSVTAVDYFDEVDNLINFYSDSAPFIYNSSGFSKSTFVVPESIRGPNCPSDGVVSYTSTAANHYLNEGIFSADASFLILPYYNSLRKNSQDPFIFVFPEGTTPLIYFKLLAGYGSPYKITGYSSRSTLYLQILSKVSYDLYSKTGTKIGSFDASTTTYTCIDAQYTDTSQYFSNYLYSSAPSREISSPKDAGDLIPIGSSVKCYPYICICADSNGYYFNLKNLYGNKCSFSIFRNDSLGFYVYISPDLLPSVEDGSINGPPPIPFTPTPGSNADDWADIKPDWDNLYTGLQGDYLPEYPDTSSIFNVEVTDVWELPEKVVVYLIEVVRWFSDAFTLTIEKYASPISKVFSLMAMLFEGIPDYLRFLFIFAMVIILSMKILQFSTNSMSLMGSIATSHESSAGRSTPSKDDTKKEARKDGGKGDKHN